MPEKEPPAKIRGEYGFPPESPLEDYKLKPTHLQVALKGVPIAEIIPYLSEIEKRILVSRYRFTNGSRRRSQEAAAESLGLSINEYRRLEGEALEQVNYLAGAGRADEGGPSRENKEVG